MMQWLDVETVLVEIARISCMRFINENEHVKQRESFRRLAPSVRAEHALVLV